MNASPESDSVIANPLRASGLIDTEGLEQALKEFPGTVVLITHEPSSRVL